MRILNEVRRSELVAKSKSSDKEKDGKTRFQKRVKSRILSNVKNLNQIDMNKLFYDDILTVFIDVQGETDKYVVSITFGGFLNQVHRELRSGKEFDLRVAIKALVAAFNSDNVYVRCSCLHPDTKIKLLDGTSPTVEEMFNRYNSGEQLYVYSVNENGDFVPGTVESVWVSGSSIEFIKVTLDNDEELLTTPDHLYMLRDGTYCHAEDLVVGQSLMPLYFGNVNGYETVKSNSNSRYKSTLRKVETILRKMLADGAPMTLEEYDKYRLSCPNGYPKITKCFSSVEDAVAYFQLNHKIKHIERIISDETPVYNISVKEQPNFLTNAGVILHNCPDFQYRLAYHDTKNDTITGAQELRPSDITNPNDTKGPGCKHIMLVLANHSWLIKVASVIVNYVNWMKANREMLYADAIYPALYGKKYTDEEPVQMSMDDTSVLDTDIDTLDRANQAARAKGQFKQGNEFRFTKGYNRDKNQIGIEDEQEG